MRAKGPAWFSSCTSDLVSAEIRALRGTQHFVFQFDLRPLTVNPSHSVVNEFINTCVKIQVARDDLFPVRFLAMAIWQFDPKLRIKDQLGGKNKSGEVGRQPEAPFSRLREVSSVNQYSREKGNRIGNGARMKENGLLNIAHNVRKFLIRMPLTILVLGKAIATGNGLTPTV